MKGILQSTLFLLLLSSPSFAQRSFNASGGLASSSGNLSSYTIGQTFYTTASGSGGNSYTGMQLPAGDLPEILAFIPHRVFSASGKSIQSMNHRMSYSMGQAFYALKESPTGKTRDGIIQPPLTPVSLSLQLFIEGFYIPGTGTMRAVLAPGITDSITVELHQPAPPYSAVFSTQTTSSTSGLSMAMLPPVFRGKPYYVVVKHRNSIQTWSRNPIVLNAQTTFNLKN